MTGIKAHIIEQKNREHPIVFWQIARHINFLTLVHTKKKFFSISLSHAGTISSSHLFIARCSAEISKISAHERLLLSRKWTIVAKQSMQHLMHECCVSSRKLTCWIQGRLNHISNWCNRLRPPNKKRPPLVKKKKVIYIIYLSIYFNLKKI